MVYYPTLRKAFNIFESRYIEMFNRAINEKVPIAVCYGLSEPDEESVSIQHESIPNIRRIAGCGIPRLLQRNASGQMLVSLEPVCKVQILEVENFGAPYSVGLCREIVEFETVLPESLIRLQEIELEFRKWGQLYFQDESQYSQLLRVMEDPVNLIASYSEFVVNNMSLKQAILELDDINDKIKIIREWAL